MSYALFSNTVQVSQAFRTKAEVWKHAADSGLVIEVSSAEEDPPRRILAKGYTIDACAPDIAAGPAVGALSLAPIITGCSVNQPSAAAAS
ncbi:hypothetical protein [Rhodopseudomonas sp. P2A-2r]|uniref:hypothetical protein n=1 Tax=unclassified Rhodopseudomonas TaxID=2638247 RepID=UPI002234E550|nr:hypothetical protein [Rhodopseudomonas sp. P2A-2r]UZE51690.1 hypothetical protein ONR75_14550 [Rhodopseudomonas sp. P2A-2r]